MYGIGVGGRELFSTDWKLSEREYTTCRDTKVAIPIADGITLDAVVTRPDDGGTFPVLVCAHAYNQTDLHQPMAPVGFSHRRGHIEAGDPAFFARRGYVHITMNVRGTGGSGGLYDNLGPQTIADLRTAIEWAAQQPWSAGNVGMFGISFFAIVQPRVAENAPKALKAIFAPYGYSDLYRDRYYHGGILNYRFAEMWLPTISNPRARSELLEDIGQDAYEAALEAARSDPDLMADPFLRRVLNDPQAGRHPLVSDVLLQPFHSKYHSERSVDYAAACDVPAYFGACWGVPGLHLPGALRSFSRWKGPKKLTIGPPLYLDRPFYQYHNEALRWFDHWLKGNDTGMMGEPDVQLFLTGSGQWREGNSWPVENTRFTRFYLHENGRLLEREHLPEEGATSFEDSPYKRGSVEFWTPDAVEETEIAGPIALDLHAKTSSEEILWFVTLLHRDTAGTVTRLTRGWLRGSQRALDEDKSRPWQPHHLHTRQDPVPPGEPVRYQIEVRPYGLVLKPGERLGLRIKCADDEAPETPLEAISLGHLARQEGSRVTILHNDAHPSNLILPITRGNRIGMFESGGHLT